MKRIITLLLFLISIQYAYSQNSNVDFSKPPPDLDTLLPKIATEKNDSTGLVEKNKQIRLATAKKTIEKLERKPDNL